MQKMILYLSLCLFLPTAWAEKRVALVIGNASYSNISVLRNSVNDAQDIAVKLRQLDFKIVTLEKDLDHKQMKRAIRQFGDQIKAGDVALFYYAGHGVQSSDTENYLIPLGADIEDESDLAYKAINANWVLSKLQLSNPSLKIMILDACRDNPFRGFRGWRGSNERGLARMRSSGGTIIAYAADEGQKASDGNGRNGLYTQELLKLLGQSGVRASQMFSDVSWEVSQNSLGKGQIPFLSMKAVPPIVLDPVIPVSELLPEIMATPSQQPRRSFEPETVFIQGGTFQMGCVSGKNCQDDEKPVHTVSVSSFYMGKTEITFDQWDACVSAGGCSHKPDDEGWGRGNRPVINVSWDDAQEYVAWLSKETEKNYRLPTEAEWEYAARAGSTTKYSFGNNDNQLDDYAWYGYEKSGKQTHPVAEKKSNAYGLYDMHGNVWEWTCSVYKKPYNGSEAKCVNANDSDSIPRVLRGGSWDHGPSYLRSANRSYDDPDGRYNDDGFRVLRTF